MSEGKSFHIHAPVTVESLATGTNRLSVVKKGKGSI